MALANLLLPASEMLNAPLPNANYPLLTAFCRLPTRLRRGKLPTYLLSFPGFLQELHFFVVPAIQTMGVDFLGFGVGFFGQIIFAY